MLLRQLYTSRKPLGWLSLLRRPQSARQVSKMKRIEWSNVPSGQHLGPPLAGFQKWSGRALFSICRALFLQLSGDFFPRSAALILGPQTGPSFKGPCRRGPNSGPISRDSGGDPRNSTFLHGWLTPTAKKRATCNVAVVALLARADILSRALCLMSDGSCLPPGASCLLSPFSCPNTR